MSGVQCSFVRLTKLCDPEAVAIARTVTIHTRLIGESSVCSFYNDYDSMGRVLEDLHGPIRSREGQYVPLPLPLQISTVTLAWDRSDQNCRTLRNNTGILKR
jgi:hypothetical protein